MSFDWMSFPWPVTLQRHFEKRKGTEKGEFEKDTGQRKAHEDVERYTQLEQKQLRVQIIVDESSVIANNESTRIRERQ
jgi:hypothetical protein